MYRGNMFTYRKAVIAAAAVFALFFLLRSRSSAQNSIPVVTPEQVAKYGDRSYPASSPAREKTQEERQQRQRQQQLKNNVKPRTLRERLQYQFQYDLETKFPAYIWQTWKVDPSSGSFGDHLRPFEASWSEKHPGFIHEVVTDENAIYLINYLYAAVPEVVEAYKALPIPVLKADFFRYLILFARGGIYSDIDTQALKPAMEWLPAGYDRNQVGLIVGIEADPDREDWREWYSRRIQFCQWTIQAKPGHPVLRDIVATITEDTLRMKQAGILKEGKMGKSIVEFSGPALWTDVIFSYFNNRTYFSFTDRTTNITWEDFMGMTESKKVGDVIVLPITSFSPGVGQMGAGDYEHPMAFVRHAFDGTWKPAEERNPIA